MVTLPDEFTVVPFNEIFPVLFVSSTISPVPDAVNKTLPVLSDVNDAFPVPFETTETEPLIVLLVEINPVDVVEGNLTLVP